MKKPFTISHLPNVYFCRKGVISIFILAAILFNIPAIAQISTFSYSGSIVSYTVPTGVTLIRIAANGAQGGGASSGGGKGAFVQGDVTVTPGQVLTVLVGQQGQTGSGSLSLYGNGGGGGSFVITGTSTPLIIAGGGGGVGISNNAGQDGQITNNGGTKDALGELGGTGGNGGQVGLGTAGCGGQGHGGGGVLTNGGGVGTTGGRALVSGGAGGFGSSLDGCVNDAFGGFGCGGAGGNGGGGGGGYSGGAGGSNDGIYPGGGGGGSYNAGVNQVNTAGSNSGNGSIVITVLDPAFVNGGSQTLSVCENSGATSINSLLTIHDHTAGLTETWSVTSNPSHGSLSGFNTTGTSIVGDITPSGLTFTPSTGFSGTDAFTIQISNGTFSNTTTFTVTVNPLPATISGVAHVCPGAVTTLSNSITGGTWSSSNTSIATVNASSGSVTAGSTAGTTIITYALACGKTTITVTVNPLPSVFLTTGGGSYCSGSSGTLIGVQNTETGVNYQLFLGLTPVGSPVAGSGPSISFGLQTAAGTYTAVGTNATTGCSATMTGSAVVSINPIPNVVVPGNQTDCNGSTQGALSFSGSVSGTSFSWTNSNSSIGLGSGGAGTVCGTASENGTVVLTAPIGSVFTSVDFASFGTPNGSCGSFTIGACDAPNSMSVVQSLVLGNRTASIVANNTTFTDPCFGTAKRLYVQASYSSTGSISAFTATNTGATPISGAIVVTPTASGCTGTPDTFTITVNPTPTIYSVTGGGSYCSGGTGVAIGLSNSQTGISYQLKISGTPVGSPVAGTGSAISFGLITTAGTYTVSATNATTSCTANMSGGATVTINPLPASITGTSSVCAGATTALTDATTGGTWSSSNSNSTVVSSGTVTGVTSGTSIITYKLGTGCAVSNIVTVNPLPTVSAGSSVAICAGASTTLSATSGLSSYSWSPSTDLSCTTCQSPVATPTVTITYTVTGSNGTCSNSATVTVTVNPLPVSITGTTTVYTTGAISLTDATTGGAWSSSNTAVGTVNTSGVVTGVSAGTTSITYSLSTGCRAFITITDTTAANAGALNFDGSNDRVDGTNTNLPLGGADRTIEAWINLADNTSDHTIFSWGNFVTGQRSGFITLGNHLYYTAESNDVSATSAVVPLNTWTHVAVTTSGRTVKFYINGSLAQTGTLASPNNTTGSEWAISNTSGDASTREPFNGSIDEIRVWNRVLCQGEIANSMSCQLSGTQTGLVAYYQLNQGLVGASNSSVTTITDSSTSASTGTLSNFALAGSTSNWVAGNVSGSCSAWTPPTATITAGGPTTFCAGGSVALTANSGTGYTYQWTNSGSNISGATAQTYTAATSGAYAVTVTVDGNCTATSTGITVTVNPLPTDTASAGGPTTFCAGGAVTLTGTGNAGGNALKFNGSTQTVDIAQQSSVSGLGSTAFTLEAWIYYSNSGVNSIIRKDGDYNLYINGNTLHAETWNVGIGNPAWKEFDGSVTLTQNKWTHVAATWDGTNYKLYVNGVADPSPSASSGSQPYVDTLHIGYSPTFVQYFQGKMDELRIWDTARTSTQIAANMSVGVSPTSKHLAAYYKFDEGTGSTLADATGNGNNGTLVNSPTWEDPSTAPILFNSYAWSPGSATTSTISATATGSYSVTVTNSNGCTNTSAGTSVTVNPLPTVSAGTSVAICKGSSTTLSATSGLTSYSWSPSAGLSCTTCAGPVATPTVTTTYTVTVTNSNSCSNTAMVTVTVNPIPTVSAGAPATICSGGSTTLTASGGATYSWAPSSSLSATTGASVSADPTTNTTYTVTGTSAASCSSTATVTVTVHTAPVITCAGNVTQNADAGVCNAVVAYGVATATGTAPTITYSKNSGTTFAVGVTTVTATATNTCGVDSCHLTITVSDNQNPTITAPIAITVNADAGSCSATGYALGSATTADNCGVASVTNNDSGSYSVGTHTITWTVTDIHGNATTATQSITVVDNQNPTITAPIAITVNADAGSCSVTGYALGSATTADNCGVASVTNNDSGSYSVGTHTITWTVTDIHGNATTATQSITVVDNQNPTITAPIAVTVNADAGSCSATGYALGSATTADNCGVASVTNNDSGSYSVGTHTITWTVTDIHGNATTATQSITVVDNQNPTITAPIAVTVNADAGSCSATGYALGSATTADNCGVASVTNNDSGSYSVGTHTITWTVTDIHGNATTATQSITVVDNQNPTITAPIAITVNADAGSCSATGYALGSATTADNCGVATVTNNDSGSYSVGTHTITWTVTDIHGNATTATQSITVVDNQNPTITAPIAITVNADAGSCSATGYALGSATTADNCGVASVTNNDSGSYSVGTHTITWTVTDIHGNATTATQSITVVDNQNPTITAPIAVTVNADAGSCSATGYALGSATTADNCGVATVTNNDSGSYSVGTHTITWTVTDIHGNATTATQSITVVDNQNPTITAPIAVTVNADAGSCSATGYALGSATTADNCGVATVTNNDSGSYSVGTHTITWTVTDIHGNATTATQSITVVDNQNPTITAPIAVTVNADAGSCSATGYALGSATTADNCGVASVTNNDSGSYSVGTHTITWTVTDIHGNATTATQSITVVDNQNPTITAPIAITVNADAGSCSATGYALGSATTADNCGVATVTNNDSGSYSVGTHTITWTVTDIHGNATTVTQSITVVDNQNPTITAPIAITINADAGSCSATGYALGSATTADNCGVASVTNNDSGSYSVGTHTITWTVTDIHGNATTATQSITVVDNQNPTITAPAAVTINGYCRPVAASLGTPVTADNCGVAGYTNDAPFTFPVGTTTVTWTVTDIHGNKATATQLVTVNPATLSLSATTGNVSCYGGSNGTITTSISGGTAIYTYLWSNGDTTASVTGLTAATYSVAVTDAHSCITTGSYTLTQPTALSVTPTITNVNCYGNSNGSVSVSVSGGTSGYTYSWSTGSTATSITSKAANTYTLTVTDAHRCTATSAYTITQPAVLSLAGAVVANVTCRGMNNGSVTSNVTGGTTAYSYTWSTGSHAANITGLAPGTYSVTVTDAHTCATSGSYTITQPSAALALSASTTNALCNGLTGKVTTTVSGGTSPYTYAWSNGSTAATLVAGAGTYSVTVTDAHGCTVSGGTYTITQPTALVFSTYISNVSCHGGNDGYIDADISGGIWPYSYSWSTTYGSGYDLYDDLFFATAAVYTVTVTDGHGCTLTAADTITQPAAISITAVTTNVSCHGSSTGAINTTVTGGTAPYYYSWSGWFGAHDSDRTGLSAGTYYLSVTDANGCSASATYTITQPEAISLTAAVTNVSCHGSSTGSINTTVSGGTASYSYKWSNGSTVADPTGLAAGTYTVTVTDANGCTASASYTIASPSALVFSTDIDEVSCHGGTDGHIDADVSGGYYPYTYTWATGGVGSYSYDDFYGPAGTYTVTVTDKSGCAITAAYTVTEPSALSLTAVTANVSCHGSNNGSINTTVAGGTPSYSYSWSGGAHGADPTSLSAGTYPVTVTDANGCKITGSYTITQPSAIAISGVVTNTSCHGGSNGTINTSVSGGSAPYTYNWSGSVHDSDRTGLSAGTYNVTVTDANGCTATASYTITSPAGMSITATETNVSCHGGTNGSINTTVTGGTAGYSYLWSNSSTVADPTGLAAATYTVTVTDAGSCTATASYTVTQPAALSITATTSNVSCYGGSTGSINTTVSGGTYSYNYLWSNGSKAADPSGLTAGTYSVTVTDAHSCTIAASYTITQPLALTVAATVTDVTCHHSDGSINTTTSCGSPSYSYSWSHGPHTACVTGLSAGTYSITVTDYNSCTKVCSYTVNPCHEEDRQADTSTTPTEVATVIPGDRISVYPNPTEGTFNVEIPLMHKEAEIVIADLTGKTIERRTVTNNTGDPVQFNLANVAKGVYVVKVNAGETTYIGKLIVR